jgi:hypothetical protein
MTPKPEYGKTIPAPTVVLPELETDMTKGQPLPSSLGKTEVPVHVLQELATDFGPTVPALHLEVTLQPEAAPWDVSVDLFRLYAAINDLDLSLHGGGLFPGEASCEERVSNATFSVTFRPAAVDGAAERLARLVRAVNETKNYPTLLKCEAKIVSIAA